MMIQYLIILKNRLDLEYVKQLLYLNKRYKGRTGFV